MTPKLLTLALVISSGPVALLASPASDQKIEEAAKASYNYRTVLEDHVKVKANDGVVTLSGSVQDAGEKDLAVDTVENLPGVTGVKNEITIKSAYAEHSDAWIALKVRGRLLARANVSFNTTKVDVRDGVVTLTGNAENAAQKELTGIYAKEIEWVKSVNNQIVITDSVRDKTVGEKIDDASITSQVKFALFEHKSTHALKTKVTTNDGVVSITGEASSDAEKSLVTKLAQDVRGTKSVTNHMSVKS